MKKKNAQGAIERPFGKPSEAGLHGCNKLKFVTSAAEKSIAQGAIEYLLLLAAAIVVVAVVISFLSSTISTTQPEGDRAQLDYLCKTLKDPNTTDPEDYSQQCRCYNNITYEATGNEEIDSNQAICCGLDNPLLGEQWNCQ